MACTCINQNQLLQLEKKYSDSLSNNSSQYTEGNSKKVKLPRGGWLIQSSLLGNIQFGIPPETVKDCLVMGLTVPKYYIVPSQRFDRKFCINFCEFEFPAYFNFFVKKTKISLICSKEEEEQIRIIFQETLLGPQKFDDFDDDFSEDYDRDCIPNIKEELNCFAKNPFNPKEPLTLDLLIEFKNFDDNGIAQLNEKVYVQKKENKIQIFEDGKLLAQGKDKSGIQFEGDTSNKLQQYGVFNNPNVSNQEDINFESNSQIVQEQYIPSNFQPPTFGITVLGCSHGFDPSGSTSGYILWVNGRGVMIDPPAFSTLKLKQMGIPLYLIGWIYISHCHADHDSGAFQCILGNQKIEIITTKTILNSFLRKYSAITGISQKQLRSLFTFRQIVIGSPCILNGAKLYAYYSLHTIPCIGFTCKFQDKSIHFSGDTYYDPENMKTRFLESGIMKKGRFEELTSLKIKFEHDIVLHEAGVPPIHTPISILEQLPEEIKEKILLVHISKKDIPENKGLKVAKTGIEETYILYGDYFFDQHKEQQLMRRIDVVANIPIFETASLKSVRNLLESLEQRTYKPGELIVKEGDIGNEFFIVESGVCKISSKSEGKEFEIYYYIGDYFGESSLWKKQKRMANVEAVSKCSILVLKRNDFYFAFCEDSQVIQSLQQLLISRQNLSFEYLGQNSFLSQLNSSQKIQLEMILQFQNFKKGDYIWKRGEQMKYALLTGSSEFLLQQDDHQEIQLNQSTLISELNMKEQQDEQLQNEFSIIAGSDNCKGFLIDIQKYVHFLKKNPGLFVYVQGKLIIR